MCAALLAGTLALAAAPGRAAPAGTPAGSRATDARPRPSSFAPHGGVHRHDYGTPIQPQILHRRNPPPRRPAAAEPHA